MFWGFVSECRLNEWGDTLCVIDCALDSDETVKGFSNRWQGCLLFSFLDVGYLLSARHTLKRFITVDHHHQTYFFLFFEIFLARAIFDGVGGPMGGGSALDNTICQVTISLVRGFLGSIGCGGDVFFQDEMVTQNRKMTGKESKGFENFVGGGEKKKNLENEFGLPRRKGILSWLY